MTTAAQRTAFYYVRRRRRAHNARTVVVLQPRSATIEEAASVEDARLLAGVTVLDNGEGESSLSLSGDDADDFELDGMNLMLKSGVTLTGGTPKVVSVDAENAVKGDASFLFTLTVT